MAGDRVVSQGEPVLLSRTARAARFLDTMTECEAIQSVAAPTRGAVLDLAVAL